MSGSVAQVLLADVPEQRRSGQSGVSHAECTGAKATRSPCNHQCSERFNAPHQRGTQDRSCAWQGRLTRVACTEGVHLKSASAGMRSGDWALSLNEMDLTPIQSRGSCVSSKCSARENSCKYRQEPSNEMAQPYCVRTDASYAHR